MEFQRILAYTLLFVSAFVLWNTWQMEHLPKQPVAQTTSAQSTLAPASVVPDVPEKQAAVHASVVTKKAPVVHKGKLITVNTDMMKVVINTAGGNIVDSKLTQYKETLGQPELFQLFTHSDSNTYEAQSGLISTTKEKVAQMYSAKQSNYQIKEGENQIKVVLTGVSNGLQISKIYTFYRGKYKVDLTYRIKNTGSSAWSGHYYTQLVRTNTPPASGGFVRNTYFGAAVSSPDKHYQKISFKDMGKQDLSEYIKGGWAAMIQHYFVSAWAPTNNETYHYYTKTSGDLYSVGFVSPEFAIAPGAIEDKTATLYSGPAIADRLDGVAQYLNLSIDYGWFWFISAILFWFMKHIHSVLGNWGWSIVGVTLMIKLVFYKLNAKSYSSMAKMRKLQPKIKLLQERFSDDKQQLSRATMELYKKEKVNPLSGCLPLLVQIPVFIGLYWVIVESVQLRQAPFIFWIHDLAAKDPFYVLPVLMGITMFIQQKLSPPPPDPMQAKVMMMLPVVFTIFFLQFPAGLVLYWVVNNSLSITQQWYMMRKFKDDKPQRNNKKKLKKK